MMAYLTGNFRDAVVALSGHGPVKQRLAHAFTTYLEEIHDDEMPANSRHKFANLRQRLHQAQPHNGETAIRASARKMSPTEAAHCAEMIVELYADALTHECHGQPLHLVESEVSKSAPLPPFLVKS